MDLTQLVNDMSRDGYFTRIGRDPRAQFGPPQRRYVGATLLPEQLKTVNAYREDAVRFRTVIAADGSRYSPAQKRRTGRLVGSMLVELGNQDIASEFTGQDYDDLLKFLETNASMSAIAAIISWAEIALNRALVELVEKQRWEAIVNAKVTRRGDNGFLEIVQYPNPVGQRVSVGGDWTDDTYDPWDDITAMADHYYDQGYGISRIITSRKVTSILARNQKIALRAGNVRVLSSSDVVGRVSQDQLNSMMTSEGLPPFETYDLRWRSETGIGRFLPEDAMVFVSTTGQDQTIDWGDDQRFLTDTVGYTAVGRPVGVQAPGRVLRTWAKDDKPPRLHGEAWQTTLPVLLDPQAVAVYRGIGQAA